MKFAASVAILAAVPLIAVASLGSPPLPTSPSTTASIPHSRGPDFGMAPEVVATADRNAVLHGAAPATPES